MLSKINLQPIKDHEFKITALQDDLEPKLQDINIVVNSVKRFNDSASVDISIILHDTDLINLLSKCLNFLNINNLNNSFDVGDFYSKNKIVAQMEIKEHVIKL